MLVGGRTANGCADRGAQQGPCAAAAGWMGRQVSAGGCRAISIPITITITISVYTVESDREIPEASIPSCKILLVLYEF
eukprot:COSAG01_NODE_47017_length_394_cov_1.850847_1_plen_78_part_10